MNVPPNGFPSPSSLAKSLMLNCMKFDAFTKFGAFSLKLGGWSYRRNK